MAVPLLVFVLIVFQHFQFTIVAGFPLTAGAFAGTALWIATTKGLPRSRTIVGGLGLIAWVLASALSAENYSASEYVKTFCLLTLGVVVMTTLTSPVHGLRLSGERVKGALFTALLLVSTISVLQAVTGALGSRRFFNPWGTHQYLHEYDPHFAFTTHPRAHGFYLEPSYDAFVISAVTLMLLCLRYRPRLVILLCVAGLVAAQSATGLLLAGATLVAAVLFAGGTYFVPVLVTLVVGAFTVGPQLLGRLTSADQLGSSANYRLVAPVKLVKATLEHHLLGRPLGSIQQVVTGDRLLLGTHFGSSLDNGIYVLLFYFSWLGLLLLLVFALWALRLAIKHCRGMGVVALVPLWIFGSLLFSGGIVAPEYVFTIWLLATTARLAFARALVSTEAPRTLESVS